MNDGDPTLERALAELETIADSLEQDDLDLDQALLLFERGIERLRMAGRLLDSAHGKVEELIQGATDRVETRPLDAEGEADGGSGAD